MKNEQEIRELLIGNTISLVAEGGFEKATTKAITFNGDVLPTVKMNEVYIYRVFGGKESLYEAAFASLDKEFVLALRKSMEIYQASDGTVQEQLYEMFLRVWRFVLKNEARCRYYIRYYYSTYFIGTSLANHNLLFGEIVEGFYPLFKEEADVLSIMHSVFTTLLDFAIRVYNGDLQNTENNRKHVFNVLYCAMVTYFKPEFIGSNKPTNMKGCLTS